MIHMRMLLPVVGALLVTLLPTSPVAATGARVRYRITDLGPGYARAVNRLGQVVGENGSSAYLYDRGVFTDLGSLGGGMTTPAAINDAASWWGAR